MKMSKKIAIGVLGLFTFAAIGFAVAYFTTSRGLVNKFTIGENTIKIIEEYTPPKELKKGINIFSKKVQVENTGTTDAFIRVYAEFSDSDIANKSCVSAEKNPASVSADEGETWDDVKTKLQDAGYKLHDDFWDENGPSNDWVYISKNTDSELGGYFYYTKSVAPGEDTDALMTKVATYFESADDIKDYEIIVYAESVQTADSDGVKYADSDYQTAWTEFLKNK